MQIAVLIDEDGSTSSFDQKCSLIIYNRKHTEHDWKVVIEHPLNNLVHEYLKTGDNFLKVFIPLLSNCKILIVNSIDSSTLSHLEANSLHVWEMQGKPFEFLDYVEECEKQDRNIPDDSQEKYPTFEKITENEYSINISTIMKNEYPITSKQLLKPYFREAQFSMLKIYCDHVPRWFKKDLSNYKLSYNAEEFEEGYIVYVFKNTDKI